MTGCGSGSLISRHLHANDARKLTDKKNVCGAMIDETLFAGIDLALKPQLGGAKTCFEYTSPLRHQTTNKKDAKKVSFVYKKLPVLCKRNWNEVSC